MSFLTDPLADTPLQAETHALQNVTTDSEKLLTEKLQLTRELSTLKPELDFLRAQTAQHATLLSDKLALQRQVSEFQVQIEQYKSDAKRAQAKRRNTQFELDQEDAMHDLRKALTREKRLRERAEEDLQSLQAELDQEKKDGQKKLAKETTKAEHDANTDVHLEALRRELAAEKKDKDRAAKSFSKTQADWDATKALLDDKLNQFRSKLKSTKERLREAEAQLDKAQQAAAAAAAAATSAAPQKTAKKTTTAAAETKATKKRKAGDIDPDSQKLGTPGQEKPTKRGRKAAAAGAAVGDKSTFSITPFLNRTMSIVPESPDSDKEKNKNADSASDSEGEEENDDDDDEDDDAVASPTVAPAAKEKTKKRPLATVPSSTTNIKKASAAPRTKKAPKTIEPMEKLVEEEEPASQPTKAKQAKATSTKIPVKGLDDSANDADDKPRPKQKQKMRKSLATFTSFMLEPEPTESRKPAKKRKLGGLGKTLFDEDDDAGPAAKALPGGRGNVFGGLGGRGLGPFGGALKGGSILAGVGKSGLMGNKKNSALRESDGFMFSPLKRNRGGADASFLR